MTLKGNDGHPGWDSPSVAVVGKKRTPPSRSSSPTADALLHQEEIATAILNLGVSHRRGEARRKLRRIGPPARALVEEGLLSSDPVIRAECTVLIDRLAGNDSFEIVMLLLDDPDARVRAHAIHALACDRCKSDDVCALPPRDELVPEAARLVAADPHPHVRAIALEVLARWVHDEPSARHALERAAANDASPVVRKKAHWYLPGGKVYERTKPPVRAG